MKSRRNDPILKERRRNLRQNQTEAEKTLWLHIRNRQFCELRFFRQYSVGPYILDFYCPSLKLAVELDGGQHADDEKKDYDTARTEYLKTLRIEVMRFWNNDVLKNIDGVLKKIELTVTPSIPLNPRGK